MPVLLSLGVCSSSPVHLVLDIAPCLACQSARPCLCTLCEFGLYHLIIYIQSLHRTDVVRIAILASWHRDSCSLSPFSAPAGLGIRSLGDAEGGSRNLAQRNKDRTIICLLESYFLDPPLALGDSHVGTLTPPAYGIPALLGLQFR